jgi:hypothetical protein
MIEVPSKKQQIPILQFLVWPDRGSNPRSTTLEASTLTISPSMQLKSTVWVTSKPQVLKWLRCRPNLRSSSNNRCFVLFQTFAFCFITLREPCNNQRPRFDIAWLRVTNHLYHGFPTLTFKAKRNETERNEIKRNETKPIKTKRNETKFFQIEM